MFDNTDNLNAQIDDAADQIKDVMYEHGNEIRKAGRRLAAGVGLAIGAKVVATGMILIGIPVLIHKVNKMEKNESHQLASDLFD